MISEVRGLHHVTSLTRDASANNRFFTKWLGLRRVKKTINFDVPDAYHLYYGTRIGAPGTLITYFPFPSLSGSRMGSGEVGCVAFSAPEGARTFWEAHVEELKLRLVSSDEYFGQKRLRFQGLDGEEIAIIENPRDKRKAWDGSDLSTDIGIRGLHSVSLRLADAAATAEFLKLMGYEFQGKEGNHHRYQLAKGNGADCIDIQELPHADPAKAGAGAVHHIAFAVESRKEQEKVRETLLNNGYRVTQVKNRSYFFAIYFRSPGGVLFEIATNEPGFNTDEKLSELGQGFMLPKQHESRREQLEESLEPIE
ncbi:VOC family protein [Hoeflea sp. WL0058]|uniref:VOC family protein n=1 Tax=Flavimaribacter sediminis TaxID=2865987 RepID=A0AAE2ZTD6_9HYPH|nr:VOC family protein [Flavimaribacter sediminis]MBW8640516.1 VOC family protein [Flavimaribacter sediminis]